MKFDVTIKGTVPMLQHRFSEEKLTQVKAPRGGDKKLNDEERRETAKQYLYTDNKGRVVQPSAHIEGAMIKAATDFRLAGAGKKTYKDVVKAGVFVFPEMIVHKNQDWTVDSRSVVNQTTHGRSMSYRPRLEDWELSFELEVTDPRADADAIKGILENAGAYKGIGSYRPRFGRFEVVRFDPVTNSSKKKSK
jgi:hypothetical protein